MLKRSAALVAIYLLGVLVLGGWALGHVFGGTVTQDNLALVIVLPLAWVCSYWPTVGSLLVAWKLHKLQGVLLRYAERSRAGLDTGQEEREIEDAFTLAIVNENPIPERFARPLVRRALAAAKRKARQGESEAASTA